MAAAPRSSYGLHVEKVLFYDNKKFNLNSLDDLLYYWYNLQDDKSARTLRQSGDYSVMVWSTFSWYGTSELLFLTRQKNAEKYCKPLDHFLVPPIAYHLWIDSFGTFQHDNAPAHSPELTCSLLRRNSISTMTWPARSPDLNSSENIRGCLAREVYLNGLQYNSKVELKCAIQAAWNNIIVNFRLILLNSMRHRCVSVLQRNGLKTKYWSLLCH